jgi:hypothetical protein
LAEAETAKRPESYGTRKQDWHFVFREIPRMLRTVFSIGLFAVLGLIALRFIFGILGLAVALFVSLLIIAIKVGLVLLVVYFIIRIVSPDTARNLRERWSGRP